MFAAFVRFRFPTDESTIDLIFDWAVLRFWNENEIAE